jgi:hypothetical protein
MKRMKDDSGVPEVPTAFPHTQIQLKGMWDQVQDVHYLTLSCCIVRTLPPREYGGALVVWPGMPFPKLDGRIHQSPVCFCIVVNSYKDNAQHAIRRQPHKLNFGKKIVSKLNFGKKIVPSHVLAASRSFYALESNIMEFHSKPRQDILIRFCCDPSDINIITYKGIQESRCMY